jgi:STE24 endopeptidase
MPLLAILLVLLAVQPVPWPAPLAGGTGWPVVVTTALIASLPVLALANVSVGVVRMLRRHPYRRGTAARRLERGRLLAGLTNAFGFAVAVLVAGWGEFVWAGPWRTTGPGGASVLVPFAELLVPLPVILATVLGWLVVYPAEKAIFDTAGKPSPVPFFPPAAYVGFKFRFYALFVLAPATLAAGQQSFTRFFPSYAEHPVAAGAGFLGLLFLFVVVPLAIPTAFGWVRMRDDPVRERLLRVAKRAGFRFRELYVWPTRGSVANALVLGLVPRVRFVTFTDKLLDVLSPDERDAVFGHEIGHAKHGHIAYYALFLILSGCAVTSGIAAGLEWLKHAGYVFTKEDEGWLVPIPVLALGAYLFVAFGFLSRRCERQADIYGAKSVSCAESHCTGHDDQTVYPETVGPLCPTGLRTFATALERVVGADAERPTGWAKLWARVRSWQHGPPGERIAYLLSLIDHPENEPRFQRRVFAVRVALVVGLVAVTVGLTWAVGWRAVVSGL